MIYEKKISKWEERDLDTRKDDYERQIKAVEIRDGYMEWARNYTKMASALVSEFGEETVLDTLEETWWNLQYEAGKTWREDFDADVEDEFKKTYNRWHNENDPSNNLATYIIEINGNRWDLMAFDCYHQAVALELDAIGGRKIGLSWCMGDIAAVRGWSKNTVMDFPVMALRGDNYCWQCRQIVDDPTGYSDKWTKEQSEKYGWRSIKKLEE